MPVTRIAIREGKTPEYKQALMDEIYQAMLETVAIKEGDRFMAVTEHGEHEFAYGPFLGGRSDDLFRSGVLGARQGGRREARDVQEDRRAPWRRPGRRPEDVLISW